MGVSTTKNIHDNVAASQYTVKQQQQELDVDHILTQLTLEEKVSLTAGRHKPRPSITFDINMK